MNASPSLIYDPPYRFQRLVVVGLGGTGSQVARCVARMLYHLRQKGQHLPEVVFVDPDVVERRNLGRQMFTEGDLGRSKAEVLARRFNYALGLSITWYPDGVRHEKHLPCSVSEFLRRMTQEGNAILIVFAPFFSQFLRQP